MSGDGGSIFDDVPSMHDKPIVWDKAERRFVPAGQDDDTQALPPARPEPAAPQSNERRHVVIGPEHVGRQPGAGRPRATSTVRPDRAARRSPVDPRRPSTGAADATSAVAAACRSHPVRSAAGLD